MRIPFLRKYSFEASLAIHAGLGVLCALQPQLVFLWVAYIILIEGTIKVFRSRNAYGQAHLAAAYMAGMEMVARMARIGLPHEMTKYAVILLLGMVHYWDTALAALYTRQYLHFL